jgi:hypothetical protein
MSWLITPSFTQWTPADITTALWLDAADTSTVTTVSGAVSQWNDKSGNGRNASQGTPGRRPLYQSNALNSKPVLAFDGSDDILGIANLTLVKNVSAFSVFCVVISNAPSLTDFRAVFDANVVSTSSDRTALYLRSDTVEAGGRRLDGDSYSSLQSGALTTTPFIGSIAWNFQSAALSIAFNGGVPVFKSGGFQTAGNTSNTDSSAVGIGSSPIFSDASGQTSQASTQCNCSIAEFIATQSVLADENRQRMEGYLAHKWGLTANLPANHPYKVKPPAP